MNALVMYDRETRTLWSQFLSQAVMGELAGTELEIVPLILTTCEKWKEVHLDTVALRKGGVTTRMLATTEAVRQGLSASRTETIGWQRRSWSLDWVSTAIRWRSRTLNCVPSSW